MNAEICDAQIVWRAVLFFRQKDRPWVPFRLLVVGVRNEDSCFYPVENFS